MYEFLVNINWLEVIQTIATVFVAYVALRALETWKHQSKAQKQTDFLDELTDTVHDYIQQLSQPIEMLKIIRIGIKSHANIINQDEITEHSDTIAYIKSRGKEDSIKLWEYLNKSDHSASKIQTLLAKGQVYDLNKYEICKDSCTKLLWLHTRLQGVASIIGSENMNWENPIVQNSLNNALAVKPEDIEKTLKEQDINFLVFVKDNYRAIY